MTVRRAFRQPESIKNERIGSSDSGDSRPVGRPVRRLNGRHDTIRAPNFSRAHVHRTIWKNFVHCKQFLARQSPSLRLRMSLTACGLALPPDDFITWPTNHPIAFGLDFASATLSGFWAMISSTTFSI